MRVSFTMQKDLEIVGRIVSEKYPEYVEVWDEFMEQ